MRIKLDFGQNPKPKAAPGTAIIKLRDFEETPLPDWEAWANQIVPGSRRGAIDRALIPKPAPEGVINPAPTNTKDKT